MYMNKFLIFLGLTALLAGCGGNGFRSDMRYSGEPATANPTNVEESFINSTSLYGSDEGGPRANIAVLLPTSGPAKAHGNNIKTAIEAAFLRKPKSNIKISFFDLSGTEDNRYEVIKEALSSSPDIIIGPLFAEDTRVLRNIKPDDLPVISFTSDATSLGNGVMTVNLIPTQSVEAIVRQIKIDNAKSLVILAPNNNSGELMTSVADTASKIYGVPVAGVYYYEAGKSDSIKNIAMRASLYNTRNAANTRAREILSDILTKEKLDSETNASLSKQLEKISRTETLGDLPFDTILFLGTSQDAKSMSSFLRYYGISNRDVKFYGTTLWDDKAIASDFTLSGAKYATLPEPNEAFVNSYNSIYGLSPDHLTTFGYDAANLALGMIYTQKDESDYIFDPNGYIGNNGIFRIQPNGISERALQIMGLNGSGTPVVLKQAAQNFITPLYNVNMDKINDVEEKEISSYTINPVDYIIIPEEFSAKPEYMGQKIKSNSSAQNQTVKEESIQIYGQSEEETIKDPDFKSAKPENISRKYIDNVEIEER